MKIVVKNDPSVVNIEDIDVNKMYVVVWKNDEIGIATHFKSAPDENYWFLSNPKKICVITSMYNTYEESLKDLLLYYMRYQSQSYKDIYEFEDYNDFMYWYTYREEGE